MPSRPGRVAPWVGMAITLLVLALLSVAAMVRPAADQVTAAARLVAADGGHAVLGDDDFRVDIETAHQYGATAFVTAPESFALALEEMTIGTARETSWVRTSARTRAQGSLSTVRRLHSLDADGLRLWVDDAGDTSRSYTPPLPMLPADVAVGSSWEGVGRVVDQDGVGADYRWRATSSASVLVPGAGCLDVASTLDVDGTTATATTAWCPGRGTVAVQQDGWTGLPSTAAAETVDLRTEDPPPRWQPDSWTARPHPLRRAGSPAVVTTSRPASVGAGEQTPVFTPDANGDVAALATDRPDAPWAWIGHPGGAVTAQATLGEVTVVATSRRQLVAYDATGQRLWTQRLDDVAPHPPQPLGRGSLVVADLSGTLTALDVATGAVRWRNVLDSDLSTPAHVCGDVVVAGDASPAVHAFDASDGTERWERAQQEDVDALGCDAGLVVLVDSEATRHGLEVTDGRERWQVAGDRTVRGIGTAAGVPVLSDEDGLSGLDPVTGAERWTSPGPGLDVVFGADHVAVARPHGLDVLDGAGRLVRTVPLELGRVGAYAYLSPAGSGVWLLSHDGVPTWVGP